MTLASGVGSARLRPNIGSCSREQRENHCWGLCPTELLTLYSEHFNILDLTWNLQ